jgi:hypothetical protein
MSITHWRDSQHRCWVLEYRYIFEDTEEDEVKNDLRISWIVKEIAENWPNATRMSYDQWYWYDKKEMDKFLTLYHLNFS